VTSAGIQACLSPGWFAEDLLIAHLAARIIAGPILHDADRWIRACCVVAGKFKREADFAGAKRCEDRAVGLLCHQRHGTPITALVLA
jgi:hypothetical protein